MCRNIMRENEWGVDTGQKEVMLEGLVRLSSSNVGTMIQLVEDILNQ